MKKIAECDKKDAKEIMSEHFSVDENSVSINIRKETKDYCLSVEIVPTSEYFFVGE